MVVGERSAKTCRKLWERLPEAYRKLTTYTDFWKVYQGVVAREQHQACKKGSGMTNAIACGNAVERFNLTLGQRAGRRVRETRFGFPSRGRCTSWTLPSWTLPTATV